MDFINHFQGTRKTAKDMYNDFFNIWAEYVYISTTIKNYISEIIDNDKFFSECQDNKYSDIVISDSVIKIYVYPSISLESIKKIEELLGISCRIETLGQKKTSKIALIFSDDREIPEE